MAQRTNFGAAKRARELKRLQKQEEKRLKKLARKQLTSQEVLPAFPEGSPQPYTASPDPARKVNG